MNIEKEIALKLKENLGLKPKVFRYYDELEKKYIDIFSANSSTFKDIINISTIGFYKEEIGMTVDNKKISVELTLSANKEYKDVISQILSNCCFNAMDGFVDVFIGTTCSNAIEPYFTSEMKHIYFTDLMVENLNNIEFNDNIITWVFALPISDNELNFIEEKGHKEFDKLLREKEIDVTDLRRKSLI